MCNSEGCLLEWIWWMKKHWYRFVSLCGLHLTAVSICVFVKLSSDTCFNCDCICLYSLSQAFYLEQYCNWRYYPFRCEECGKCFSQKTVLQSHSTVHTDARPHVCPQCGKAFKQFSSLYLHSKCHLPDQVKPKFPCDICHKEWVIICFS
jgi:hypothetical protein